MVREDLFDLFTQDNTDKQAKIEYSGGVMSNVELFQNSEELTESLCSEKELRFGCCEASCLKFKVANMVKPLAGEWVTYSLIVNHMEDTPFSVGRYKVTSDKLTADRMHREIVAYDAMYDILNADVATWYNAVLPAENSTVTMREFRESFIRHFGLKEIVPAGGLVNDDMAIERTIEPGQLSGKDIITAICEINGCFGHIGRDGKFHYIYLEQNIGGLYPADNLFPDRAPDYLPQQRLTGHLYPQEPKSTKIAYGLRISPPEYESFVTRSITKLQIRDKENDIGCIWPDGEVNKDDNCYIIQDNFLAYGKSHEELVVIAKNILEKLRDIIYRPFKAECVGNLCLEVGDPIRFTTKYDIVESYILNRTLKGVQALRDTYLADGSEKYEEKVNGVQKSISQLRGKTNELTRTVDETKSELKDTEQNLRSTITQTASEIRAEVEQADAGLSSRITQTASEIRTELENAESSLSSKISQNAESITAEVTRATGAEGSLSSRISINAQGISTKVGYGEVISSINQSAEKIEINAEKINLNGYVSAGGGNFEVNERGELILSTPYSELKMEGAYLRLISTLGISSGDEIRIGVGGIFSKGSEEATQSMIRFPVAGQQSLGIGSVLYSLNLSCSEARVNGLLVITEQELGKSVEKINAKMAEMESRIAQLESGKGEENE